jgi:hypothetical protein
VANHLRQQGRANVLAIAAMLAAGLAQAQETPQPAEPPAQEAPAAAMPDAAPGQAAMEAHAHSLCDAPWFRSGSRVQMEGDGTMPMSITMSLADVSRNPNGCHAQLEVRSKSAMSALMGAPVIMDQVHEVNIDRTPGKALSIESQHAVINARGRYARMFGEAAFKGQGAFNYAGIVIREGATLAGETFESSLSLKIYPLSRDEVVSTMEASKASILISSRHVGRKQVIDTALGKKECLPITYIKRTALGPLLVGGELVKVEPTEMNVTDWYCPAEAFVLRTDILQDGKVQRIDVTALEADTGEN